MAKPRIRAPPRNGDLFGPPGGAVKDGTLVIVSLNYVDETSKAWLLVLPVSKAKAAWVPKHHAKPAKEGRGVGLDETYWTMPRWVAAERGWL